jgi:hypothetical protein
MGVSGPHFSKTCWTFCSSKDQSLIFQYSGNYSLFTLIFVSWPMSSHRSIASSSHWSLTLNSLGRCWCKCGLLTISFKRPKGTHFDSLSSLGKPCSKKTSKISLGQCFMLINTGQS